MEAHLSFLNCGYNGTGYSTLLSIEQQIRSETKVYNRILINCGEGTQRVCSENRVKLFTTSIIVFNSLAPHNVSGFPGIFLALSDLVLNNPYHLLFL